MVDPAKIESLFSNLNSYLESLSQLARLSRQKLANDRISLGAAKYYL